MRVVLDLLLYKRIEVEKPKTPIQKSFTEARMLLKFSIQNTFEIFLVIPKYQNEPRTIYFNH